MKEEMHHNYFLSSSLHAGKDYLRKYYEGKGLDVIDLYQLPREVDEQAKSVHLADELGRKTFAVLDMLF